MKLKVTDQIHVSWVQADSLRPGDEIGVTPEQGEALLKAHPDKFKKLAASDADHAHAEKAEPAPLNKMAAAPANKAAPKRKAK
jgi:hypothetical protein